jgi:hypothetical protein
VRHPLILSIALAPALAVACGRPSSLAADLVITNANVWTGNALQHVVTIPAAARSKDVLTTVAGGNIVHKRTP